MENLTPRALRSLVSVTKAGSHVAAVSCVNAPPAGDARLQSCSSAQGEREKAGLTVDPVEAQVVALLARPAARGRRDPIGLDVAGVGARHPRARQAHADAEQGPPRRDPEVEEDVADENGGRLGERGAAELLDEGRGRAEEDEVVDQVEGEAQEEGGGRQEGVQGRGEGVSLDDGALDEGHGGTLAAGGCVCDAVGSSAGSEGKRARIRGGPLPRRVGRSRR